MVIDIPLSDIDTYFKEFLPWLPLNSDEVLIEFLHRLLLNTKGDSEVQTKSLKSIDVVTTPLFQQMDRETRERIMERLEALKGGRARENEDGWREF